MLPKKIIVITIIASLLLFGYKSLNSEENGQLPSLWLGFGIVGAFNAIQSLKELMQP